MKGNLNFSRINFHMKNNVAKLFDKIYLKKNSREFDTKPYQEKNSQKRFNVFS